MILGNLIFQAEVVEQRFGTVVLPHHDQQASDDQSPTKHGRMLSSNMLLLNFILLIEVTFSTPTSDFDSHRIAPDAKSLAIRSLHRGSVFNSTQDMPLEERFRIALDSMSSCGVPRSAAVIQVAPRNGVIRPHTSSRICVLVHCC